MPTLPRWSDALPVVSDPRAVAANDGRAMATTLGDLVAAIADEVDAVTDTEDDADVLIAATVFGLQWSLRRATIPTARAEGDAPSPSPSFAA